MVVGRRVVKIVEIQMTNFSRGQFWGADAGAYKSLPQSLQSRSRRVVANICGGFRVFYSGSRPRWSSSTRLGRIFISTESARTRLTHPGFVFYVSVLTCASSDCTVHTKTTQHRNAKIAALMLYFSSTRSNEGGARDIARVEVRLAQIKMQRAHLIN